MIISDYQDFFRLKEEKRDNPLTVKQGPRDFDQNDYYGLWADNRHFLINLLTSFILKLLEVIFLNTRTSPADIK